jgi:bacterioferritin
MRGDTQVIAYLNGILRNELTAINQYFLHSRMLENWGINELAHHVYQESIGEMKHADTLTKRILFLDGLPNLQDLGRLRIGETVPEMFESDLAVESENRTALQEAVAHCESVSDYISREILESILSDTEEHIDWLETQQGLIGRVGLELYLAEKMGDDDS